LSEIEMVKVLVTGATGMLGLYVCNVLAKTQHEIVPVDRSRFDLADPDSAYEYVSNQKPDVVLHLAAETDVDLCERDPQRAGIRNHIATGMIAKAASECGAWLLYVSTSNVFGSDGGFDHNELDLPSPTNYYGRSKYHGEMAVRMHCPSTHLIVRAGWMIGGGREHDHKFVGKVVKQITSGASVIKAVSDRFGSITPATLLSDFITWAVETRCTGTVHYASEGTITRLDIARAISDALDARVDVYGVKSAEFPLSAPRPLSEGMISMYLSRLKGAPRPGLWRDDLKSYVETFLE
jgi:dTDP-4-dehydrorhamnose reductase